MSLSFRTQASIEKASSRDVLVEAVSFWRSLQFEAKGQSSIREDASLGKGETGFLPMGSLIRGQDEVSVDNILAKLGERQKHGDLKLDSDSQAWVLTHDSGRSSVPIDDPIQVVKGPQGFVIIDGHHDFYLGLSVGARTIPAHVTLDLSHLPIQEFWREMKERELVYLHRSAVELAKQLPRFEDVRDNPNRYLASLLAMKAKVDLGDPKLRVREIKGADNPVWVKVGDSVPFIEFDVAKALDEAGIRYDPRWGKEVPSDVIEASRQALIKAQLKHPVSRLAGLPVFETAEAAKQARGDESYLSEFLSLSFERSASLRCSSIFLSK